MNVRDAFFTTVYEKVKAGNDIIIISSDLGAPSLDDFRCDFPHRFVNVGIAEQNSISVAAGLSLAGKTAITYGLNPFPVTRGFDHIRNIMASLQIPITIAGLKAGTVTAEAGFSHMVIENMSILRTLYNIQIINPSDETISQKLVEEILHNKKPRYVEFDSDIRGQLYDSSDIDFNKGFITSGSNERVAVITYGIWAYRLKTLNLGIKILDCFSLPIDRECLVNEIKSCEKIITIEDGIDMGGLGAMVLELLNDYGLIIPVKRMSLKFVNGYPSKFTDRKNIFENEGLTIERIKKEITI